MRSFVHEKKSSIWWVLFLIGLVLLLSLTTLSQNMSCRQIITSMKLNGVNDTAMSRLRGFVDIAKSDTPVSLTLRVKTQQVH
jgi:hypothetical protein